MPSKIRKPRKINPRIPVPKKPAKAIAPKKGRGATPARRRDWTREAEE
jgi:hypothetical protein